MCGLAGFLSPTNRQNAGEMRAWIEPMTDAVAHRGPDDRATWVDPEAGIALGSRRLAIIDVSPEGRMPMTSASGRYVIAYNGEVYNAPQIRRELQRTSQAPPWRGHSDTEVLLAAIEAWGLDRALGACNGMFAFALWDTRTRKLRLVRDRMGIKPLYHGVAGGTLVFGSELHAVAAYAKFDATIDRRWVDDYLRGTRAPSTRTVYAGIRALRPGTYLEFTSPSESTEHVYWSALEQVAHGRANPFTGDLDDAVTSLTGLLTDAVHVRMVSDVPLGVLLSGGIDSATVLALLQRESTRKVRSFSIGFPDAAFDEAPDARAIAQHVGSEHTELYVTPSDIVDLIPSLAPTCDRPMSDPSFVSNYCAYRLAGEHVTVALTGDGGDEVFGGYHRHRWLPRIWRLMGRTPTGARRQVARAAMAVPPERIDRAFDLVRPLIPARLHERTPGAKLQRVARWMAAATPEEMYGILASRWQPDDDLVIDDGSVSSAAPFHMVALDTDVSLAEHMLAHELVTYLPDGQLTKVDRASMAVSMEARVPILDHRVVEFAMGLPVDMKIRGETGKFILRQVLHQQVPSSLFERPKQGFHLPLRSWLRGPLREWTESLLAPAKLHGGGLLNPEPIEQMWQEHISGRRDRVDHLWPVLMLQSWLEQR